MGSLGNRSAEILPQRLSSSSSSPLGKAGQGLRSRGSWPTGPRVGRPKNRRKGGVGKSRRLHSQGSPSACSLLRPGFCMITSRALPAHEGPRVLSEASAGPQATRRQPFWRVGKKHRTNEDSSSDSTVRSPPRLRAGKAHLSFCVRRTRAMAKGIRSSTQLCPTDRRCDLGHPI